MSDAKGDAGRPSAANRPLSPHLLNWRPHLTMAVSIFHRFTGMTLYVGALIVAGWAAALAGGAESYDSYRGLIGSPLGKLVLFAVTFSVFYHMAGGIRHLAWDLGFGFEKRIADTTAAAVVAFAATLTVAVWVIAFFAGML
jgi:succinate dehydrogenase / fumarate reductase cytochrome b subunit